MRPKIHIKQAHRNPYSGLPNLLAFTLLTFCTGAYGQVDTPPRINGALTVEHAVELGMAHSPEVKSASSGVRTAAAETRVARSMTRVQIAANTYLSYGDNFSMLYSAGTVTPSASMDVPQKLYGDQNISLVAPLYTGGRLKSSVDAAASRERAARADVSEVQSDVAMKIREAYYRSQLAVSAAAAAQARIDLDVEMLKTTTAQFDVGKGLRSSVQRVEAELADARRMLLNAQNLGARALLDLRSEMGISLESEIHLSQPLQLSAVTMDLPTALETGKRSRPDLIAARARLTAASQQARASVGALGPQIYGMAMTDGFSSAGTGTRGAYTLGLVVSVPLIDGGQRRAELSAARAAEDQARLALNRVELNSGTQIREAFLDLQTGDQNVKASKAALTSAAASYEVIALRVQNQKSILLEQLDALSALTQARTNEMQALYDYSIAAAALQRAMGKH